MFCNKSFNFDIIVVGGGHSGVEAVYSSAKMGRKVLLITHNINSIGELSCNPSIGGIGKSNLVKEIDALGGLMGKLSDLSAIQYRILNSSKGYAVRATRMQIDKNLYKINLLSFLKFYKNIFIYEGEVIELIIKNNVVLGVLLNKGEKFYSYTTILCNGTFLDAKIFIGDIYKYGGRIKDFSSIKLANFLKKFLDYNYLKTGTPPRIKYKSINFSKLVKQKSMFSKTGYFTFFNSLYNNKSLPQINCYLTKTNSITHKIARDNLYKSSLFNGLVKAKGPRYCPSIEDKILKFPNKKNHQIFLEPENLSKDSIYPNGLSMSFPVNIQKNILNSIKGMEDCILIKPGYAVEYLFLDPNNLYPTLESKIIKNLFFAGQVNGTTGYEEAASQGLIAGINASLKFNYRKKNFFFLSRSNSYIGVLLDDLCNKKIKEPYRIFSSSSEYRLFLREDNADYRLTPLGYKLGLISNDKWFFFKKKMHDIKYAYEYFKKKRVFFNKIPLNCEKKNIFKNYKNKKLSIRKLLKNPLIKIKNIKNYLILNKKIKNNIFLKEVEILIKYEGYIKKQKIDIKKFNFYKNIKIPDKLNFNKINGLSKEAKEILLKYKVIYLKEIYNISGITPSDIIILIIYIKKHCF